MRTPRGTGAGLLLAVALAAAGGLAACSSPVPLLGETTPASAPSSSSAPPTSSSAPAAVETEAPAADVDAAVADAVAALNEARAEVGAQPVVADPALTDVATTEAQHYADGGEDFSGDLRTQLDAAGFATGAALARTSTSPLAAVQEWLADDDARRDALDGEFSRIGLAAASAESRTAVVLVLGYRADDGRLPALSQGAVEALDLTNAERAAYDLPALTVSEDLNIAAQVQADHQASILTMTHDGNGGLGERLGAVGYLTGAENVAVGQRTVAEVMQGWIDSPGHHANIVHEGMTEMGFAVAFGADGRAYFAQTFGDR